MLKFNALSALVLSLLLAQPAHAALKVPSPVPFAEDNDIADNIKSECKIQEQFSEFLKEYAGEPVELVSGPLDTSQGRVLEIEIVDAVSMGNPFMGHQKFTKIRGTLFDNGQKVASFKGKRNSMGGAFAGYKGSCSVLGRTVKVLAQDVGTWLKAPQDGAVIGE